MYVYYIYVVIMYSIRLYIYIYRVLSISDIYRITMCTNTLWANIYRIIIMCTVSYKVTSIILIILCVYQPYGTTMYVYYDSMEYNY